MGELRPLRVLALVPDLNFGGGENRMLNIARAIDRVGFDYRVTTLYSPDPALESRSGSMRREFADAGVAVDHLGFPRPRRRHAARAAQLAQTALTLARGAWRLRRHLLVERIDLIDAHLDGTIFVAVPAARAAGVPVAVTLYHARSTDQSARMQHLRRACLRAADAVVTDSAACALELDRFIGALRKPTRVVPNSVRLPAPARSRADVLADFDIPEEATVVAQVSGLVPSKGHRTLLRAARAVLDRGGDAYFLMIGFPRVGDAYVHELHHEASALGIAGRVRIASYPGCIADVWQAIDVHVHASEFDSLPNAIIEGMSMGRPAVVTAVGGIPDMVQNERTGLVVPPADPEALAAALLRVLGDHALAARLGAAASARYEELCDPQLIARQLEACFTELHAARSAPRWRQ